MPDARPAHHTTHPPYSNFLMPRSPLARRASAVLSLLSLAGVAAAQGAAAPAQPAEPLWELGGFGLAVSQQAYPGADAQVRRGLALPYFIYRGPLLRADRGTVGLRAIKTPGFELDVGFAGSFGASSNAIEARRGMPDLGTLVQFGPRGRWDLGAGPGGGRWRAELPLRGVFDLSDGMRSRGIALEPELAFERRARAGFAYGVSAGAVFGDRRLTDTFYGVAPAYATLARPAYEARAGLIVWRLAANASTDLSADWRVYTFARLDSTRGAANTASPLVRQPVGASVGVGMAWTWARSDRAAAE
jgi:outer membrane protein